MKKFRCTVTRTDEYEIELDENVMNEEWMEDSRGVFFNFYEHEEHAKQIAQMRARFGERFIEGYGIPLINCKPPWGSKEKDTTKEININIISENDFEVEAEEID